MDDTGITHLEKLKSLERLHLRATKITQAALVSIGKISSLTFLDLESNKNITEINSLRSLPHLKKIFWEPSFHSDSTLNFQPDILLHGLNRGWYPARFLQQHKSSFLL